MKQKTETACGFRFSSFLRIIYMQFIIYRYS